MSDALTILHVDDQENEHIFAEHLLEAAGERIGREIEHIPVFPEQGIEQFRELVRNGLSGVLLDFTYMNCDAATLTGADLYRDMLEIDSTFSRSNVAIYTSHDQFEMQQRFGDQEVELTQWHVRKPLADHMDKLVVFLKSLLN